MIETGTLTNETMLVNELGVTVMIIEAAETIAGPEAGTALEIAVNDADVVAEVGTAPSVIDAVEANLDGVDDVAPEFE